MGSQAKAPAIFVLGSGQDDNVGDVVLRREYFDRLRRMGRLHIYVGPASADFLKSLDLQSSDVVYVDLGSWHLAAWRAAFRGRIWFVEKPGELMLDRQAFRRNVKLLPLVIATRMRRGQVLRLGLAMRVVNPLYLKLLRPLFRLSTCVRWRDTATSSGFGFGEVCPDWAFGWEKTEPGVLERDRDCIVVTYRGDREPPSGTILDLIRTSAHNRAKRIVVVTQVRRDAERSARLASLLDAELVDWPAERTLAEHEMVLRRLYRDSCLVISDRLHALIVGMTEGAVPLCITDRGEAKVERHFDAVGFRRSTMCVQDVAPESLEEMVEQHIARRGEAITASRAALTDLDGLTAQLQALAAGQQSAGRIR